jgi:hypothetical protein
MKKHWTALLTLGISLSWMGLSTASYANQGTERVYSSAPMSSLFSLLPTRLGAVNVSSQILAQSTRRPRTTADAGQFGDVVFHGDWGIETRPGKLLDGVPGSVTVLAAPGPIQFDLVNANVPKNYQLKARIIVYDKLFDPQPLGTCWMNLNPASSDVCKVDQVRPMEITMFAKWLGGPKPKSVNNRNFGRNWNPRDSPFADDPTIFYYMEGNRTPLYSIIKNARRAKFEFPATPKPKEEDTRRCWRGITGVVSCW